MRRLIIAALCLTLSACVLNSGVVPAGPGIWTISERRAAAAGGAFAAQQDAMAEAAAFCAGQNGAVPAPLAGGISGHPAARFGPTDFTVTFACRPPDKR